MRISDWSSDVCSSDLGKTQQQLHDPSEQRIDPEKEQAEKRRHDHHHDGGYHRLPTRRQYDLARFGAHLPDKIAGRCFSHKTPTRSNTEKTTKQKQIGRATRRERAWQKVKITVGADPIKK